MSSAVREASVVDAPLSVDRLLQLVSGPSIGGVALFVGVVRDHDSGADVVSLDYTQHPSAAAALNRVAQDAADRYDVLAVAAQHRIGHLAVGDLAVVVAVGAVHRRPALDACAYLIDTLKAEVPIWKEQTFTDGAAQWVGLPEAESAAAVTKEAQARTQPAQPRTEPAQL